MSKAKQAAGISTLGLKMEFFRKIMWCKLSTLERKGQLKNHRWYEERSESLCFYITF